MTDDSKPPVDSCLATSKIVMTIATDGMCTAHSDQLRKLIAGLAQEAITRFMKLYGVDVQDGQFTQGPLVEVDPKERIH